MKDLVDKSMGIVSGQTYPRRADDNDESLFLPYFSKHRQTCEEFHWVEDTLCVSAPFVCWVERP
jgi:hypothetical protein